MGAGDRRGNLFFAHDPLAGKEPILPHADATGFRTSRSAIFAHLRSRQSCSWDSCCSSSFRFRRYFCASCPRKPIGFMKRASLDGPNGSCTRTPGLKNRSRTEEPPLAITILPTVDEVRSGAAVPFAPKSAAPPRLTRRSEDRGLRRAETAAPLPASRLWRSLSVAPTLTRAGLLKCWLMARCFLSWSSIRWEPAARERRAQVPPRPGADRAGGRYGRSVRRTDRAGILERKDPVVLCPEGLGGPMPGIHRASGPFVNPDHFANYLAMILPLALVGAIFRAPLEPAPRFSGFQLLCAVASLMIIAAILISLSRAGWIEIGLGILTLAWLLRRRHRQRPDDESAGRLPSSPVTWWLAVTGVALLTVVALGLLLVGPGERQQAGTRVAESISSGVDLRDRWALWVDSSRIVRDYPLFGAVSVRGQPSSRIISGHRGRCTSPAKRRTTMSRPRRSTEYWGCYSWVGSAGESAMGCFRVPGRSTRDIGRSSRR